MWPAHALLKSDTASFCVALLRDSGDHDVWRAHFGQHAGSGAGDGANAAVPEPATEVMFIVSLRASALADKGKSRKLNRL
jgi:hypothetical protein